MEELGKIESVKFGFEEYLFGLSLTLSGKSWGVGTGYYYNPNATNVTEEENDKYLKEMTDKIQKLLKDAKVNSIHDLKNKPVLCTFDGSLIKDFRILTEVL